MNVDLTKCFVQEGDSKFFQRGVILEIENYSSIFVLIHWWRSILAPIALLRLDIKNLYPFLRIVKLVPSLLDTRKSHPSERHPAVLLFFLAYSSNLS